MARNTNRVLVLLLVLGGLAGLLTATLKVRDVDRKAAVDSEEPARLASPENAYQLDYLLLEKVVCEGERVYSHALATTVQAHRERGEGDEVVHRLVPRAGWLDFGSGDGPMSFSLARGARTFLAARDSKTGSTRM